MILFLIGFASAFAVSFLAMVGWWFLIHYRRPATREEVDARFQEVRRAVLESINSDMN